MCSVHTYTSFVIQEIFDCKLLEIRQYSSCLLIPIPSSIDAAASNLQNLGEIAQEFFNQTLSNLELGYIFELNNSQFSTKFLSCLNFHFKVLDRNSIVGNSWNLISSKNLGKTWTIILKLCRFFLSKNFKSGKASKNYMDYYKLINRLEQNTYCLKIERSKQFGEHETAMSHVTLF